VTGGSTGTTQTSDYATLAYDAATGHRLWRARYNGAGSGEDTANSAAVSPDGTTVFVTGSSTGSASLYDFVSIAYDAESGQRLWTARYNGPANDQDGASSVALSPDGARVFVTGTSTGLTSGLDYATVAYDGAIGRKLWVTRYNGPGNDWDTANSVVVSPDGVRVFVTGYSTGSATGWDYATAAYRA
jgi:WD40 repeat protein